MNDALATYDSAAVMEVGARHAMDKRLFVNFYRKAVLNKFKSSQEGRPIFDEVDYVRIIIPGDKYNVVDTPATEEHTRVRFAEQYERFLKGQEQATSGTPLEMWPQLTISQVAELKAINVYTVEQLAEMSDQLAQKFMGNHQLRQKAKLYLEAAAGEAVTTKMQAELEKRDNEIETLKAQMAQLMATKQKAKE